MFARIEDLDRVAGDRQAGPRLRDRFELLDDKAVQRLRPVRRQVPIHEPIQLTNIRAGIDDEAVVALTKNLRLQRGRVRAEFADDLTRPRMLYGAIALHIGLALRALYRRRRLKMATWEAAQMVLGLAIPPLLLLHVLSTRFAHEILGVDDSYITVILAIFVFNPAAGVKQVTVLLIAWLHGCIGLHFWLRIRPWYAAVQPYAFAAALLLPAVSLAGFLAAGREVARLAADPDWLAATLTRVRAVDPAGLAQIKDLEAKALIAMAAALGLVLLARVVRGWHDRRRPRVEVSWST